MVSRFIIAGSLLLFSAGVLEADTKLESIAVSPGSAKRAVVVEGSCPTFSWGAVEGAAAYELVVYGWGERVEPGRVALRERLPGSATSWTPSGAECLSPGRYAWAVRAESGSKTGKSDWSEALLFRVGKSLGRTELESTLARLVERYVAVAEEGTDADAPSEDSSGGRARFSTTALDAVSTSAASAEQALDGADFSIDASGNALGLSFGGDGSGLTNLGWGNLAGVPAGFADDVDDVGPVYGAGNQLALDATTFNVLEGSGSDLDADLLDGLEGAAYAQQATTYTKAEVDALLTVDNIEAPVPHAPVNLRVGPEYGFPGMRRLSWTMQSLGGVASFVVYQAGFPIDEGNKATAQRQVATSLHAPVDLFPGSGVQHFRVEAVNVFGEAGPLSDELAIDTTSRIAYEADYDAQYDYAFYTVPAAGGSTRTKISPSLEESYGWSWSPDGGRIAYASFQTAFYGIEVVPAAGGSPVGILDPDTGSFWMYGWSWSPDGSRIAYRADPSGPESSYQLWTVPATGGPAVRVNDLSTTEVAEFPSPAWSPDGSRLLYVGVEPVTFLDRLYSAPANGGGATELTGPFPTGAEGVMRFAWSPDGSRVAYIADQETASLPELWVVPSGGGTALKVSAPVAPGGYVNNLVWSPDGTRIAYQADLDADALSNLFVVPASGGASLRLSEDLVPGGFLGGFEWSPDGTLIAYAGEFTVDGRRELRVVPAVGGTSWRVSSTDIGLPDDVGWWRWSPRGDHLACVSSRAADFSVHDGELYLLAVDGSEQRVLNGPLAPDEEVTFFDWSPDGSRIAYKTVFQGTIGVDYLGELFLVGIGGGEPTKVNDDFEAGRIGVTSFAWSPLGN